MVTLPASDLLVEAAVLRPKGGQHVGIDSSVKVTHLPTGLVAIVASERSQHKNKEIAVDMIIGGLTNPRLNWTF